MFWFKYTEVEKYIFQLDINIVENINENIKLYAVYEHMYICVVSAWNITCSLWTGEYMMCRNHTHLWLYGTHL